MAAEEKKSELAVGLMGVGVMGGGRAANLLKAGFPLCL